MTTYRPRHALFSSHPSLTYPGEQKARDGRCRRLQGPCGALCLLIFLGCGTVEVSKDQDPRHPGGDWTDQFQDGDDTEIEFSFPRYEF